MLYLKLCFQRGMELNVRGILGELEIVVNELWSAHVSSCCLKHQTCVAMETVKISQSVSHRLLSVLLESTIEEKMSYLKMFPRDRSHFFFPPCCNLGNRYPAPSSISQYTSSINRN